ncbi:GspH/FimT family pseudopilin [Synechococcus sp. RSCCF101]|uniref:GspH/FimT family pseudopilin n=1 Tax=Synechococcus sp. RSCCF101 TaxID=2511069 RepID=UPI00178681F3|nr:GspH/FimT family pseudopilin [Synechococcus sp. RSCCF101]
MAPGRPNGTRFSGPSEGFSLCELLVVLAVAGLLSGLLFRQGSRAMARQRLDHGLQTVLAGLSLARSEARERARPCGLQLEASGWTQPRRPGLDPCEQALASLRRRPLASEIRLSHSFPGSLRFTGQGLVLDGGTAVLEHRSDDLRPLCAVMSLPLGIVRTGRYHGDAAAPPLARHCLPRES